MAKKGRNADGTYKPGHGKKKKKGAAKKKGGAKKGKARAKSSAAGTALARIGSLETRMGRAESNIHVTQKFTLAVVNEFRKGRKMKRLGHLPGYVTPTGRKLAGGSVGAKQLGAG